MATGDDEESDEPSAAQDTADERLEELARKRLVQRVRDRDEGISVRIPKNWDQSKQSGLITLESGDRCVSIALAAPVSAAEAGSLLDETVAGVRNDFEGAGVQKLEGERVGGLPGESVVIQVEPEKGDRVRVLITVGRGKQKAYLTQVVLRDPDCGDALIDSQLVVNSIEYTK